MPESFDKARDFIKNYAMGPDLALFEYYFENGSKENVLNQLKKFQNQDGGFGTLEYDFELERSSGMATVKAFQYIQHLEPDSKSELIRSGVNYFVEVCDLQRLCFQSVPPEVNDVPHAFWWNYSPEEQNDVEMTWEQLLEEYNPNTNAEIVAYLLKYRDLLPPQFPIDKLKQIVIDKISSFGNEIEVHVFLCYLKLYDAVTPSDKVILERKLMECIKNTIEPSPENWSGYTAQPIMFVDTPNSLIAKLIKDEIELNLNYLIQSQGEDGSWSPTWSWGGGDNEEAWKRAETKWKGYLTVQNLIKLSAFGRLSAPISLS